MSNRKPHNDWDGYVCERKSHHPQLPGHLIVLDRQRGGDWVDSNERWVVFYEPAKECGFDQGIVGVPTKASAIDIMKHAANGGNDIDFGQNSRKGGGS